MPRGYSQGVRTLPAGKKRSKAKRLKVYGNPTVMLEPKRVEEFYAGIRNPRKAPKTKPLKEGRK